MIGETILHYKIIEELGRGGMGVVYKAEDTKLKRDVAIKFLPRQIAASEEERQRFKIEAQAPTFLNMKQRRVGALNHPNIATIHNIEEVDDEMFIVMEYIGGRELREIIHEIPLGPPLKKGEEKQFPPFVKGGQGGFLPIDDVLNYATQIASGLQAAHKKGVTHRDIKSSNIMITEEGQVKIMDFGLAKVRGSAQLTKAGTTLGTAAYMSPEQMQGTETDHRTDIWAFGVVVYEMLTGELPFKGDYEQAVIYSILNEEPESLADVRPDVPQALQQIVAKTLAKNRDERYQTTQALLADLKTLQGSGAPTLTGFQTRSELSKPNKPRWPMAAAVAALALLAIFAAFWFNASESDSVALEKSIAVLPFKNLSADQENEYFSDGITEDIITQVSKISDLRVISRTSIMRYKDSGKPMREIGQELGVATILEGSVRKSGNQIRVVAQLINTASDAHLWAETYDRELTEIFAIQSEVARNIADALQAELSPREARLISQTPTDNVEAYSLYLKSRYHWEKYNNEDFRKGIDFANQAIAKDPNYALAYAGLAQAYYRASNLLLSSGEAMPKAKEAALKALQLDDTIPEAHIALAVVKYRFDYNWQGAEEHFQRAIALNSANTTAHEEYGCYYLVALGRFDEALKELHLALQLAPYSLVVNFKLGFAYFWMRDYARAVEQVKHTLELYPNSAVAYLVLGASYIMQEEFVESGKQLSEALRLGYSSDLVMVYEALLYAYEGNRTKALELVGKLTTRLQDRPDLAFNIAAIHAVLGEKDEAFHWLKKAYESRSELLMLLGVDANFDNLRSDTRFAAMLEKIGLKE